MITKSDSMCYFKNDIEYIASNFNLNPITILILWLE